MLKCVKNLGRWNNSTKAQTLRKCDSAGTAKMITQKDTNLYTEENTTAVMYESSEETEKRHTNSREIYESISPYLPDEEKEKLKSYLKDNNATSNKLGMRLYQEKLFREISLEIVQGFYLKDLLEYIFETFKTLIPYDRIGCALLEEDNTIAKAYWAKTQYEETPHLKVGYNIKMENSSLLHLLGDNTPRIINDLKKYLEENPTSRPTKLIVDEGIQSSLTCVLRAKDKPLGFLFFSSREPHCYEQVHQETYQHIADMVSIMVEKSLLYEKLIDMNKELTKAQTLLKHQASHDGLTTLLNHRTIIQFLDEQLASKRKNKTNNLCAVMLDIDNFKDINDSVGHPVGDKVLQVIANSLQSILRNTDKIGRYGGEEFLVVAEVEGHDEAYALGERLRTKVESLTIDAPSDIICPTISLGVALMGENVKQTSRTMIKHADTALYESKRQGRNRVTVAPLRP